MVIRIGLMGYGTIGKRVADAVMAMDDMELVGVIKQTPDYESEVAINKGIRLYTYDDKISKFEKLGIKVAGTVNDLIKSVDVMIDATPDGVGAENKVKIYEPMGLRAVFQGGEEAEVADVSFNALANYDMAIGRRFVRVVSCNTTALSRLIGAFLVHGYRIRRVRAYLVRRGADPREFKKGPINDVVFNPATVPSHHGPDVMTVIPTVDVVTMAVAVPTTMMHLHMVNMEFDGQITRGEAVKVLEETPRVLLFNTAFRKFDSLAQIIEWARDIGRLRGDVMENAVIEDSITVFQNELFLMQGVHQESIVVPENIDAVRAMFRLTDKWSSIRKTDSALNLVTMGKNYNLT
ncbi:type II glyceraldehyde-3-phosphate dehydrogenase [Vulcanisaeta souniana]|uniref:Glyceraldehyde-3-phosphate dehydrogenase n=1 Tax=Vulcanisaeta souniana JCM 11219 TaxID=1293586 RepID=A0A830E5L9_9CREN|nr:type II glyceraldehyde-3-phosphate dehydrogenase [Vulcanisaeta souniana]BDR91249.1 glyceraldehyde-3-phosphate dehydrogenase [Vulcanisaeta souniana JCM 11219]GGI85103.1 glyceraldehyde-3-phosphate dehydrogenase [Vulcanisaeta souniana JCM 11219]